MTANTTYNDFKNLELIKTGNSEVIKSVTAAMEKSDENFSEDYNKILNLTAISIKMHANSNFKDSEFLEINEIDKIKSSLANYTNQNKRVEAFKNELIEDLTDFQKRIRTNHIKKIVDLTKEKQLYEMEINSIQNETQQQTKGGLFQIRWPANTEKRETEGRIAAMQAKIQNLKQKILHLEQTKPVATEKDLLLYRMHMKEKYAR